RADDDRVVSVVGARGAWRLGRTLRAGMPPVRPRAGRGPQVLAGVSSGRRRSRAGGAGPRGSETPDASAALRPRDRLQLATRLRVDVAKRLAIALESDRPPAGELGVPSILRSRIGALDGMGICEGDERLVCGRDHRPALGRLEVGEGAAKQGPAPVVELVEPGPVTLPPADHWPEDHGIAVEA